MSFDDFMRVLRGALDDFEAEAEEDFADEEDVDPDEMLSLFSDMVNRRLEADDDEGEDID